MRPPPRSLRWVVVALAVALLVSLSVTLASAPAASAHAVVVSSSPSADERLSTAPSEVSIVFSEAVTSDLGGITVLDSSGARVDQDDSQQPTPTSVRTTLQPDLGDGTYIANYKVVSADGHPIVGFYVFGVGNAQLGDLSGLASAADPFTERLGTVARFVTYAAALLAAGLAFFIAFLHDGARDRRRMAGVVQVATIVAAVGALASIAVQASLATGEGLGAIAQVDVLQGVLREGLGWATAVLFVGLALCHLAVASRPSTMGQALSFYGGLAVTTSFVFWGHAREAPNPWLAMPADVIHVMVAAVWFGGLVGLTMTLRGRRRAALAAGLVEPTLLGGVEPGGGAIASSPSTDPTAGASSVATTATAVLDRPDRPEREPEPATNDGGRPAVGSLAATVAIVRRFSTTAAISVVVLAASGVALGWGELGSLGALTSTSYGQTLLVKLAIVGVILVLAGYNRFLLLPWLLADDTTPSGDADRAQVDAGLEAGWRTLLRSVAAEALLIVAVLAVTAVLVNVVPGRTDAVATGPFAETQTFRDGTVTLTVTPNQAGVNSFHVDFGAADGRPADLAQKVTLELSLPAKDLGPIEREMVKGGTGHFILEGMRDLSIPGTWDITLNVRVSDFDQQRVTFTDTVG